MRHEEILEGIKLIADSPFGGMTKNYIIRNGIKECIGYTHESHINSHGHKSHWITDIMLYHTSWDWLMPVVEKIEKLGFPFEIKGNLVTIGKDIHSNFYWYGGMTNDSKIISTMYGIVAFIKWYNEQNLKP